MLSFGEFNVSIQQKCPGIPQRTLTGIVGPKRACELWPSWSVN